jgi:hypothetical protein
MTKCIRANVRHAAIAYALTKQSAATRSCRAFAVRCCGSSPGAFAFESARIKRLSKDHGDSCEMREKFPRKDRFVRAADGNRHDRDWETASLRRWKVAGR